MKVNIVSKPNQKLKYLDPDFDTEGVDEDDYEYIYCEDFFATSDAEDYIASNIFDYDYDKGVVKFEFNGTDDELMEYGADYDGSPELWEVYERIEKFAEEFDIDWEICEFIDDSGTQWGESVV
tara:strand:+ start:512 stop:880 length:369 start_codon:yes stop_codon:yes gene_type:complete